MRVWIVDDAGYPSGFAGGKFTAAAPGLRMQALEVVRNSQLQAAATSSRSVFRRCKLCSNRPGGTCNRCALAWRHSELDRACRTWTVLLADHEFRTSPDPIRHQSEARKRHSAVARRLSDPAATAQYLQFTHEQYKNVVGDEFGKTIMGFRGDEPDYSISGLPWTPKLFERFRAIKGYDVQPYAALFTQTPSRQIRAFPSI